MSLPSIAAKIITTYDGKETEHNWEKIDTLLKEFIMEIAKNPTKEQVLSAVRRIAEVLQDVVTFPKNVSFTFF